MQLALSPCPPVTAANNVNSACVTRLNTTSQHVTRRCAAHDPVACADADQTCELCTNAGGAAVTAACNRNPMPTNRRSCVQCEGALDSVCAAEQLGNSRPCLVPGERCFTRRSDRLVTRGCQTQHRGLCDDAQQCLFCANDNCNSLSHNSTLIPMASGADGVPTTAFAPMLAIGSLVMLWKTVA